MLEIDTGSQIAFEPNHKIEVGVSWDLSSSPDLIELRLVWNTTGKGDRDLEVADRVKFELPPTSDRRRVSIQLPREPYSFSGKLISIVWALELVALPGGESTRTEIVIGPNAQEVLAHGGQTNAGA